MKGQSIEDRLADLQVNYWREEHPQKRGHLMRKMMRLVNEVYYLEACWEESPDYLPEEDDR